MKILKSISMIRVVPGKRSRGVTEWILLIPVVMALLAGNGCVHFNDESEPPSWPKPISATDTKQFDGVFTNQNQCRPIATDAAIFWSGFA